MVVSRFFLLSGVDFAESFGGAVRVTSVSVSSWKMSEKSGTLIVDASSPFNFRGGLTGLSGGLLKKLSNWLGFLTFVLTVPCSSCARDSLNTVGSGDSSGSSRASICCCICCCLSGGAAASSWPSRRRAS